MNYLQLCQRLRSEAGISGTGPASVVSQTGHLAKIVDWIQTAYEDIQNINSDWFFLQTAFSFSTIPAKQEYSVTDAGLSDHQKWKTDDWDSLRCYSSTSDEQRLDYLSWNDFRSIYLFGTARDVSGRPSCYSVKPDMSLVFYPIPDSALTISGEYFKKADVLSGNTDTPLIPSQYHMVIVWRALMLYGAYESATEKYSHGQNEYNRVLSALKMNQEQAITWGPPLA